MRADLLKKIWNSVTTTILVIVVILAILLVPAALLYRAKKKGDHCFGCPDRATCDAGCDKKTK